MGSQGIIFHNIGLLLEKGPDPHVDMKAGNEEGKTQATEKREKKQSIDFSSSNTENRCGGGKVSQLKVINAQNFIEINYPTKALDF